MRPLRRTPLALRDLSAVLWASDGYVDRGVNPPKRTHASAGGLYPVGVLFAARDVEGIEPGLYDYRPEDDALCPLATGTEAAAGAFGALGLDASSSEPFSAVLVTFADLARVRIKYGLRSYRFALVEAGLMGAHISLAATSLGIDILPLGSYLDDELEACFGLDGVNEVVVGVWALSGVKGDKARA